jgi:hypothetical protein
MERKKKEKREADRGKREGEDKRRKGCNFTAARTLISTTAFQNFSP